MHRRAVSFLLVYSMLLPAQSSVGERVPRFELSVDNIMRGPGLTGYAPCDVRWSGRSDRIYFRWKRHDDPVLARFDTYVIGRDGAHLRKLASDEAPLVPPVNGTACPAISGAEQRDTAHRSVDRTKVVSTQGGDLFLYDFTTDTGMRLTRTAEAESNPRFLRDGRGIVFTRSSNLFRLDFKTGLVEQLTDIRPPAAGSGAAGAQSGTRSSASTSDEEEKGTDSQEYLKKEERDLLDVVKQRKDKKDAEEAAKKKEDPRKPIRLQQRQTVSSLLLTPDEKHIVIRITQSGERAKTAVVPNYVTDSAYSDTISARTKVGDAQGRPRLGFVAVDTGEVKWLDHGLKQPIDPKTQAVQRTEKETSTEKAEISPTDRELMFLEPVFSDDGTKAVMLGRSADHKERWIMALDPPTGKGRVLYSERDEAWINGPGATKLGWLKGDDQVWFLSERSGYSHLYAVAYGGGEPRALTSGKWEVHAAELSKDKTRFFLETNEPDPAEHHFFVMPADGGSRQRITSTSGWHEAVVSEDERYIADIYSFSNKPHELYVADLRQGAPLQRLTNSPAPDFNQYAWIDPPIVQIPASDGVMVPGHLYKPKNSRRGGPAVIFVHGAGYLQNIHRGWSNYFREYMFHHLLMERGYTVLDIDYRASEGYGRDWRAAIYRHMGGRDLEDHVDAAKWLVKEHGIDPKRIGIYGGSYGGFITLMAMFTKPGVFAAGAALRPVTDWAHYNHPYTSNILNTPQADAEAFKRSSPIYFAEGFRGALLICHGMVDVNVHFQDTVRLVQRLIELRKENWELAAYPAEDHAFVLPASWADEYKRILKLFETNLR